MEHQRGESYSEDGTELAPQDEGRGYHGLLPMLACGEDGHEGAGELEALADAGGDETQEVGEEGPAATHGGEKHRAEEVEEGAEGQGPFQASGVRD